MPTAAQTALARGHAVLFAQHGEVATWAGGTRRVRGVRQVRDQAGLEGRGTIEETEFVVRRVDLPTQLPQLGDTLLLGGATHRLAAIRPGQLPGTLALVLEEVVR